MSFYEEEFCWNPSTGEEEPRFPDNNGLCHFCLENPATGAWVGGTGLHTCCGQCAFEILPLLIADAAVGSGVGVFGQRKRVCEAVQAQLNRGLADAFERVARARGRG